MADGFEVEVEGVRELLRATRDLVGREGTKEFGRQNKAIGEMIISRLAPSPQTVGAGAGAKVRPSANARLVQLVAGGKHRVPSTSGGLTRNRRLRNREQAVRVRQWGRRPVDRSTPRPDIIGTAVRSLGDIEELYLTHLARAARNVGLELEKGR